MDYGWFVGGYAPTYLSTIDRIDYSGDAAKIGKRTTSL